MTMFQNELDLASISLDQRLKNDIQSCFQATRYSLVSTESMSQGALGFALSDLIPAKQNKGSVICQHAAAFHSLCDMPASQIDETPSAEFAQKVASHMAEKTEADISIALLGIKGFPKDDVLQSKMFLAYQFKQHHSHKVLELSGSLMTVLNQCVMASLGFLHTLFLKYAVVEK